VLRRARQLFYVIGNSSGIPYYIKKPSALRDIGLYDMMDNICHAGKCMKNSYRRK
jgi:hypothetical protein